MFTQYRRNIRRLHSKDKPDLEWGLRPILLWMEILGMLSGRSHSSSVVRRAIVLTVGVAMMIWKVSADTVSFIENIQLSFAVYINQSGFTSTQTEFSMEGLNQIQIYFSEVAITLNFFTVSHFQWGSLWKKMCEIEKSMKLDETFYRSLRKMSWAAIVVIVLVSCQNVFQNYEIFTVK